MCSYSNDISSIFATKTFVIRTTPHVRSGAVQKPLASEDAYLLSSAPCNLWPEPPNPPSHPQEYLCKMALSVIKLNMCTCDFYNQYFITLRDTCNLITIFFISFTGNDEILTNDYINIPVIFNKKYCLCWWRFFWSTPVHNHDFYIYP